MIEPRIFTPDSFDGSIERVTQQLKNGRWVLARGIRLERLQLRWRLKLAFGVFTGKYDALLWIED